MWRRSLMFVRCVMRHDHLDRFTRNQQYNTQTHRTRRIRTSSYSQQHDHVENQIENESNENRTPELDTTNERKT